MCKRAFLLLLALMIVPSFASATVYWQINTTTSPATYNSNLTAVSPTNVSDYTSSASLTKVTNSAITAVGFNVAAVAGTSVVVKVDGVQVGTTPGTYTVTKGTVLNHNIVAYYSTAASSTITTQPSAGGMITPSFSYVSNGVVTMTPFAGYQVSGLLYSASKITTANPGTLVTLAMMSPGAGANGSYSHTISSGSWFLQAVFTPLPVAKAVISTPNMTVQNGTSIAIDGSTSSTNVAGALYAWSASCGTIAATAPNALTATYTAPAAANSCTVTLTVSAAGVSPTQQQL